jgi:four helix bundle protein
MRDPQRLLVAQRAIGLAVDVYRLTDGFPPSERFGLSTQMRRAAVSIGSNIAEGCGRPGNRDFLRFLYIARASATELAFQNILAAELGFGSAASREAVSEGVDHIQRMLNRFTSALRTKAKRSHAPASELTSAAE